MEIAVFTEFIKMFDFSYGSILISSSLLIFAMFLLWKRLKVNTVSAFIMACMPFMLAYFAIEVTVLDRRAIGIFLLIIGLALAAAIAELFRK